MTKPLIKTELSVFPNGRTLVSRQGTIKGITALFLADLQDDWAQYGRDALAKVRERSPEMYVAAMVSLAKAAITRQVQVDVQGTVRVAQTREQVLTKLEEQSGPKARELFENLVSKIEELERESDAV